MECYSAKILNYGHLPILSSTKFHWHLLRRHFRSFHLACCDAAGAGCWNIGDWVDITHGALYINALWWFMRKCCRQVKDYTNRCCWVLFPRNLPIFSPLVLVFVCFCQLFLVRSSQMWWFVSKLLLLKSHCAVSWKWLSAVRSVVTRVITLELGRSHTCPPSHPPPPSSTGTMDSADWGYVETELFVVDWLKNNRSWKLLSLSFSNLYLAFVEDIL